MPKLTHLVPVVAGLALLAGGVSLASCSLKGDDGANAVTNTPAFSDPSQPFDVTKINHVIVIYQENWSFDGLYSQFPGANGLKFNTAVTQVNASGGALPITMPQPLDGSGAALDAVNFPGWTNTASTQFFNLQSPPAALGLSQPLDPGAITGDIVHRFYTHQAQLGGLVTGSAAGSNKYFLAFSDNPGLVLSGFDATYMPEGKLAQAYTMCDMTFQGAFGGSFLTHQFLVAAAAPEFGATTNPWSGTAAATFAAAATSTTADYRDSTYVPYTVTQANVESAAGSNILKSGAASLDVNAVIADATKQLHVSGTNWNSAIFGGGYAGPNSTSWDNNLTATTVDATNTPDSSAAGRYHAVNTIQPAFWPLVTNNTYLPPATNPHIGDLLDGAGKSWHWYSEGWKQAVNGSPSSLFQYHHQPFNYFKNCGPGQKFRKNLQDLTDLYKDLDGGTLPNVSFVKLLGPNNEHPGYSSLAQGQQAVADLVAKIQASGAWKDTAIFITYDEFGGRYDHVTVPAGDKWGPGTRVPMIVISPFAKRGFVDHTVYDSVSIIRFIEKRYGLGKLSATSSDNRSGFGDLTNAFSNNPVGNG
jgi:phospholipase C